MKPFDIKHWQSIFPWESIRTQASDTGTHITSPVDLVMLENQRRQIENDLAGLPSLPTEVFTFSLGDPDDPTATKIGGVPFRQLNKPWPQYTGFNYRFLGQFNFTNAHDLVGDTPEELLLIFALEDFSDVHLEWVSLDIDALPRDAEVPSPGGPIVNCHAIPYRTTDYHDSSMSFGRQLTTLTANKIGGMPCDEADGEIEDGCFYKEVDHEDDLDEPVLGRHICTLSSVQTNPLFEYPWCNYRAAYGLEQYNDNDKTLMIVDMGSISIYLTDDEETYASAHYY